MPLHALTNIVAIALCGVVADCDGWDDVAAFGRFHAAWFKTFLDLPYGIPSSDTFRRVFTRLNTRAFQAMLTEYAASLALADPEDDGAADRRLAIDGKTLRGSFDRAAERSPLHLVQAMSTDSRLVLAQTTTTVTEDEKVKNTNEIKAIPKLLDLLDIQGATISIDAIGCQAAIAAKIIDDGGDYLLALKDNHPKLAEQIGEHFLELHSKRLPRSVRVLTVTQRRARGRDEERAYVVAPLPASFAHAGKWRGLRSIAQTTTVIRGKGAPSIDTRYYLTSLAPSDIDKLARCARRHWRIESAHWTLDMTFGEDASRIRKGHGPENFASLRRVALGLLKAYQSKPRPDGKTKKPSLRCLRKRASWNVAELASIVTQRS